MSRPLRRRLLLLAALAAGAALSLSLGLFPQEPVRRRVESRLKAALGPSARLGALRVVPGRLAAEARDVVLEGEGYRLEVSRVALALDPSVLLGGPLSLSRLELDAPRLELRPSSPQPQAAATAPRIVAVRSLVVRDGTLRYADPSLGTLALLGVGARGSLGTGALEIEASGGALSAGQDVPIHSLRAHLEGLPRINGNVRLLAGRSQLRATGSLGAIGALDPDVAVEADVDLEDVALLTGAALRGAFACNGRIHGAGSALALDARLSSPRLLLAGWPLETLRGSLGYVAADDGRGTLSLTAGFLRGRLGIEGRGTGRAGRVAVELQNADLDALRQALALDSPLPGVLGAHLVAEGDLSSSLRLDGRLDATRPGPGLELTAHAEAGGRFDVRNKALDLSWTASADGAVAAPAPLRSLRLAAAGTAQGRVPPDIQGELDGTLQLAGPAGGEVGLQGRLRSRADAAQLDLQAEGLGGTATAQASLRGNRVESLSVVADSLDLASVLPDAKGNAGLRFDGSGSLGGLALTGRADFAGLEFRQARIGGLTAAVDGTQQKLVWTLSAPELALSGRGEISGGREGRLRGTLASTALPLGPLAPLVIDGLDGSLSASVDLDVPLAGGEAGARVRLERLEAQRGPWSVRATRPITAELRGSRVELDAMRIEGRGGVLEATGGLGLKPDDPLNLRVTGDLDLAQLPAPDGWTLGGHATADVLLSGTRATPDASGQLSARALSAEGPPLPQLGIATASVELAGGQARLAETAVAVAGGEITLCGTFPLALALGFGHTRPGEGARAHAAWKGIEPGPLLDRFRPGQGGLLEGTLAGQLDLEAAGLSLATLDARLEAPETRLTVHDVPTTLAPLSLDLRGGHLTTGVLVLDTPGGRLSASGTIDLAGRRLDGSADGALALRTLSPWLEVVSLSGTAEVELSADGSFDEPRPRGQVRIRDASARMREIPQALTDLNATLAFDVGTLRIEDGSAVLGGGAVTLAGESGLAGTVLQDARFSVTGRDIALRYPVGLRSRVDADLTLTGRSGALLLGGTVKASRGIYDLDLALEESFRAAPRQATESALLRSLGLDLQIETLQPVRVKNNLADLEAGGSLRLRGDLQEPIPFGRLELQSGGKVFLQQRTFAIESGQLEYTGSWDPGLNISAQAQIRGSDELGRSSDYAVDIQLQGSLDKPAIHLVSQPTLSEPEIVSLIATGRTRDAALRSGGWVAGEQAAILLSGHLTRGVSQQLRRLGFDEVTIQPELLARETDPGARFTFGKQLGPRANLLYSLSLNNPEDRFGQLEVRPGRSTTAFIQRLDDGTLTYGGGQRFEWGGPPRPKAPKEERTRLQEVRVLADAGLPEAEVRKEVDLRPGDRVTSWQLQDKADKLRDKLRERGHIEAEVAGRLEGDSAVLGVRAGARYNWRVEGLRDPPDLGSEVRRALFEEEAVELCRKRLLADLYGRGHLRAEVESRVLEDGPTRTLLFSVKPGPVLSAAVQFPGAREIPPERLLQAAGGAGVLLASPEDALRRVRDAYAGRFHLAAEVGAPQVVEQAGAVVVRVPVEEGPRARLAGVAFEGALLSETLLTPVTGLEPGRPYDPELVAQAALRVRERYLGLGYPSVRVATEVRPEGPDLRAVFRVREGPRVTVAGVEVVGATRTHESLVRRQVTLKPGDPLDPRKLAEFERRLLELGIFSRVAVVPSDENPTTLRVELRERARLNAGYDYRYNEDDKSTIQLDGEVANIAGRGLALGGRLKLGQDVREVRGSLGLPEVPGAGDLVGSLFQTEEDFAASDPFTLEPIEATRVERGFQLQFARRLPNRWTLLYGYRFKRSTVRPIFAIPTDIAALETSLLRDTRDSPLDARRGRFWSFNVEYSPALVGSDLTFIKGLGQLFVTRSIGPSWVWAQGYRLGLAHGFDDQTLISSERFTAGGANSVRGYASDSLGSLDVLGEPAGGQAVAILNQELRFHHRTGLGLAGFYDVGNVFATVSDMSFDLRHAAGLGLRWESPVGLLRLDFGFPLNPEPRDKGYRIYIGLGQAF